MKIKINIGKKTFKCYSEFFEKKVKKKPLKKKIVSFKLKWKIMSHCMFMKISSVKLKIENLFYHFF